jgi:hypothetical protein
MYFFKLSQFCNQSQFLNLQLDVIAFANLAQIHFIDKEIEYPLRDFMGESCPNLVGLVNRMKERCFPDWDDMCTNLDLNSHLPKPPPKEETPKEEPKKEEDNKEKEAADKKDNDDEKVCFVLSTF